MSFSAEWLQLREPVDKRARNSGVSEAVRAAFAVRSSVFITDIACGTGSTLRAVAPLLGAGQSWTLVDYDAELLAEAKALTAGLGHAIAVEQVDLVSGIAAALPKPCDLVTMSAFLDLVSEDWLIKLIADLSARKLPLYAALNYDGRTACNPAHPADEEVLALFRAHQKTDKGFGPALGPDCARIATAALEQADFTVVQGRSDWEFLPDEGLVQSMLVDGWASAAHDMAERRIAGGEVQSDENAAAALRETIEDWRDWHLTRIAEGASTIMVGHVDLFAVPPR